MVKNYTAYNNPQFVSQGWQDMKREAYSPEGKLVILMSNFPKPITAVQLHICPEAVDYFDTGWSGFENIELEVNRTGEIPKIDRQILRRCYTRLAVCDSQGKKVEGGLQLLKRVEDLIGIHYSREMRTENALDFSLGKNCGAIDWFRKYDLLVKEGLEEFPKWQNHYLILKRRFLDILGKSWLSSRVIEETKLLEHLTGIMFSKQLSQKEINNLFRERMLRRKAEEEDIEKLENYLGWIMPVELERSFEAYKRKEERILELEGRLWEGVLI